MKARYPPKTTGPPTVDSTRSAPRPPYCSRVNASPANSGGTNGCRSAYPMVTSAAIAALRKSDRVPRDDPKKCTPAKYSAT